jgi:hypothetical protein
MAASVLEVSIGRTWLVIGAGRTRPINAPALGLSLYLPMTAMDTQSMRSAGDVSAPMLAELAGAIVGVVE